MSIDTSVDRKLKPVVGQQIFKLRPRRENTRGPDRGALGYASL